MAVTATYDFMRIPLSTVSETGSVLIFQFWCQRIDLFSRLVLGDASAFMQLAGQVFDAPVAGLAVVVHQLAQQVLNVPLSCFHWPLIVPSLMVRASGYRTAANDGRISPAANAAQGAQALADDYGKWSYVMLPSSCALRAHHAWWAPPARHCRRKGRAEKPRVVSHAKTGAAERRWSRVSAQG